MSTLNKMPAKLAKKTALAPKPIEPRYAHLFRSFGTATCLVLGILIFLTFARADVSQQCDLRLSHAEPTTCIQLEQVSTQEDLEKGLSGRHALPADSGMLFMFKTDAPWCFWMKGMKFPIDIVWLNSQKQVVYIVRGAQPSSYPAQFCPPEDARYVIEVNEGIVDQAAIVTGSQLQF